MNSPLIEQLFEKHVPSAIRESKRGDFVDEAFLSLAQRTIDEFWTENKQSFVRHSAYKLDLEKTFDSSSLESAQKADLPLLLKMFMAAEIELKIEQRMTIEQRRKLGKLLQNVACGFLLCKWFGHARFCFSRGAQLFGDLRLHRLEDECWYYEKKATMYQADSWARALAFPIYIFAGFGYRPYRLLYLGFATVAIFSVIYSLLQPAWSSFQCVSVSSMNYLTALGYGDIKDTNPTTQTTVILQGFLSLVLNSTLFALLVRKWFR